MKIDDMKLSLGIHKCVKVYVACTGLKKWDRKIKNHNLFLGFYSEGTTSQDCYQDALKFIKEEMKNLSHPGIVISIQEHEIEINSTMRIDHSSSDWIFGAQKTKLEVKNEHL